MSDKEHYYEVRYMSTKCRKCGKPKDHPCHVKFVAVRQEHLDRLTRELAEAREKLAAAERDTQRLDFLQRTEQTPYASYRQERRLLTDGSSRRETVTIFEGWALSATSDILCSSIRAAIDAALAADTQKQEGEG